MNAVGRLVDRAGRGVGGISRGVGHPGHLLLVERIGAPMLGLWRLARQGA
jgi:hypothetical protein